MHVPEPVERRDMRHVPVAVQCQPGLRCVRRWLRHVPVVLPDMHGCVELQRAGVERQWKYAHRVPMHLHPAVERDHDVLCVRQQLDGHELRCLPTSLQREPELRRLH